MTIKEIINLKEELLKEIKDIELRLSAKYNSTSDEIANQNTSLLNQLNNLTKSNEELINSVTEFKISVEKIPSLEKSQKKTDNMLSSHEMRINTLINETKKLKQTNENIISNNLVVSGYIGPSCKFVNLSEYLNYNINEVNNLKNIKETEKQNYKSFRNKLDYFTKNMCNLVDSAKNHCKDYTDNKEKNFQKILENKLEEFNEKNMQLRTQVFSNINEIEKNTNLIKEEFKEEYNKNNKEFREEIENKLLTCINNNNNKGDESPRKNYKTSIKIKEIKENITEIEKKIKNINEEIKDLKKKFSNKNDDIKDIISLKYSQTDLNNNENKQSELNTIETTKNDKEIIPPINNNSKTIIPNINTQKYDLSSSPVSIKSRNFTSQHYKKGNLKIILRNSNIDSSQKQNKTNNLLSKDYKNYNNTIDNNILISKKNKINIKNKMKKTNSEKSLFEKKVVKKVYNFSLKKIALGSNLKLPYSNNTQNNISLPLGTKSQNESVKIDLTTPLTGVYISYKNKKNIENGLHYFNSEMPLKIVGAFSENMNLTHYKNKQSNFTQTNGK